MKPLTSNPLVSVIIPNFNYGHYLKSSIESVLNQTYDNIELIVVDDGSTDDSVAIAAVYGQELKLIRQSNAGVSAARNSGIAHAKGTYICFLDSDDTWLPEKVELQISRFRLQNVGLVYSSINICDKDLIIQNIMQAQYKGDCLKYFYRHPIRSIILLGCSTAMVHKDVIEKVGGYDVKLNTSADWDYFRRVSEITEVDFVEQPVVNYRRHNTSMSAGSLRDYYRDNEKAIRKFLEKPPKLNAMSKNSLKSSFCWLRFQLGAVKALVRGREFGYALERIKQIF